MWSLKARQKGWTLGIHSVKPVKPVENYRAYLEHRWLQLQLLSGPTQDKTTVKSVWLHLAFKIPQLPLNNIQLLSKPISVFLFTTGGKKKKKKAAAFFSSTSSIYVKVKALGNAFCFDSNANAVRFPCREPLPKQLQFHCSISLSKHQFFTITGKQVQAKVSAITDLRSSNPVVVKSDLSVPRISRNFD